MIPAGYQLHTLSWENDGDNYKTTILSGLTKAEVRFYIDLGEIFKKYGNDFIKIEILKPYVKAVIDKHSNGISDDLKFLFEKALDSIDIYNILNSKILENPDEGYGIDFCRAVESVKVFFIPNEIQEVTEEFI